MDLTKLSRESLLELDRQIKETLINKEEYVLKLKVDKDGDLLIYYTDRNNIIRHLGWLSVHTNMVEILKNILHCHNYEKWRDKGMKFNTNIVEWKNGRYQLYCSISRQIILKRIDIPDGNIYNFNTCETIPHCKDINLLRFKHNLKPY